MVARKIPRRGKIVVVKRVKDVRVTSIPSRDSGKTANKETEKRRV